MTLRTPLSRSFFVSVWLTPAILAQAAATPVGTPCKFGGPAGGPYLTATPPVVAKPMTFTTWNAASLSAGVVFLGLVPASPLVIPPNCFLYIGALSGPMLNMGAFPIANNGVGSLPLPLPSSNTLVGVKVATQVVVVKGAELWLTNGLNLTLGSWSPPNLVSIAPGTFSMGSTFLRTDEQPVHTVHITRPFWIGRYEVTQAEYQAVRNTNPSLFKGDSLPVEQVTWNEAMAYCAALNKLESTAGRVPAGYQYRLPTEAEWEYCCRAGTTTEFNVGTSITCAQVNYLPGNPCVGKTTVVGTYAANAWGLHDMHGNCREWCLDSWDRSPNYPVGPVSDPYVTAGGERVIRGGGWDYGNPDCRSARRDYRYPSTPASSSQGFRVVLAHALVQ